MRQTIGGTWILMLVIIFILLFSAFIILTLNYSRTVRVKNELRNKVSLTSSQDKAADANGDGKISSADYVRIKNYLRGKASINI